MGSNAQVMTAMTTADNLISGLVGDVAASNAIATSVVQATYDTIVSRKSSSEALATKAGLKELYKRAYISLAPAEDANTTMPSTTRRLLAFAAKASDLDELFEGTADVSGVVGPMSTLHVSEGCTCLPILPQQHLSGHVYAS